MDLKVYLHKIFHFQTEIRRLDSKQEHATNFPEKKTIFEVNEKRIAFVAQSRIIL